MMNQLFYNTSAGRAIQEVREYLVLLTLPQYVKEAILPYVHALQSTYNFKGMKAVYRPHVTLLHGIQFAGYRDRILNGLHRLASEKEPFSVNIKGFLPWKKTFCLHVDSGRTIRNIFADERIRLGKNFMLHTDYTITPHITLARNLEPWESEMIGRDWAEVAFNLSFLAVSVLVLERIPGVEQRYRLIDEITFDGRGRQSVQQLELF